MADQVISTASRTGNAVLDIAQTVSGFFNRSGAFPDIEHLIKTGSGLLKRKMVFADRCKSKSPRDAQLVLLLGEVDVSERLHPSGSGSIRIHVGTRVLPERFWAVF